MDHQASDGFYSGTVSQDSSSSEIPIWVTDESLVWLDTLLQKELNDKMAIELD